MCCIMAENSYCILREASSRLSSKIHHSVSQDLVALSLLRSIFTIILPPTPSPHKLLLLFRFSELSAFHVKCTTEIYINYSKEWWEVSSTSFRYRNKSLT